MKRMLSWLLTLVLCIGVAGTAQAATTADVLKETAAFLQKSVSEPTVASIGGEWTVLGLARSGIDVPDAYYETYYKNVVAKVQECEGVLHSRKYTEYSRVILALTAIGKDPANVGGYNLIAPLGDFDKTVWQGVNGAAFALIALDSGDYKLPEGAAASRDKYIEHLLAKQLPDGGWALSGDKVDTDITGMVLQALAGYTDRADVKAAVERSLAFLSSIQDGDGGFSTYGDATCESTVQVIVALGELGIALDDSRFVKNGKTLLDGLMEYYAGGGSFEHIKGGGKNAMATEQAFYALVAAQRAADGQSSLYKMAEGGKAANNNADNADNNADNAGGDAIRVYLNGSVLSFDVEAQVMNSTTLVPLRGIFEALDASVNWNGANKDLNAVRNGRDTSIYLKQDSTEMRITEGGQTRTVTLLAPATAVNGRILVPLRAISEAFGCDVAWDGAARAVKITAAA